MNVVNRLAPSRLWLLSLPLLAACAATQLSVAGERVQIKKVLPRTDCRDLGVVVGYGADSRRDDRIKSAYKDIRNSAARLGANILVLDMTNQDDQVTGRAYSCLDELVGKARLRKKPLPVQRRAVAPPRARARPAPPKARDSRRVAPPRNEAEARLRQLEELYRKGLISEREYRDGRRRVLEQL